ncbi:MAG TPA: polysaccharide deacetylase family protein [Draconibacterium sp.]|nr:polysaccharide deacetylase family protein [Draconibacterium sp.]
MKHLGITILVMLLLAQISMAQFKWPDGKKAAVVFTYDDGLDCHLDVAVPQLDEFGLKGTFFCTGNSPSLNMRMEDWRAIVRNGHELGNHTLFHPCDGTGRDWVKPEYDLRSYTKDQIISELNLENTLLKAVDGKEKRTFAYTCGDCFAGDFDFSDEITQLFEAARLDGPVPENMSGYNVWKTPSWGVDSPTADELIAYVNEALSKGTIAIFMFHSVGGGYLNVGAEEHHKLLEFVKEHENEIYTGTFMEVMDYIKKQR